MAGGVCDDCVVKTLSDVYGYRERIYIILLLYGEGPPRATRVRDADGLIKIPFFLHVVVRKNRFMLQVRVGQCLDTGVPWKKIASHNGSFTILCKTIIYIVIRVIIIYASFGIIIIEGGDRDVHLRILYISIIRFIIISEFVVRNAVQSCYISTDPLCQTLLL